MYSILMTVLVALAPSNMELAEDALIMSLEDIPGRIGEYGIESVAIEIEGEHAGSWFIKQTVSSMLHENGYTVAGRTEEGPVITLRIRPMELVVDYGDVSRPWVVGNKRVDRIATV